MNRTTPEHHINRGVHGARGLFCMCVVVYHVYNGGLPMPVLPAIVDHAFQSLRYGVELFFAISGFVIFGTLRRSRTPWRFLLNRFSRILPVLWVVVLIYLPLGLADADPRVLGALAEPLSFPFVLLGNLFALGPLLPVPVFYGVTWTISYEFTFYTLCYFYLAGRDHAGLNLRLPIILLGLLLVVFHPRAMFFLCGILVAQGYLRSGSLARVAALPGLWLLLFLALWHTASVGVATDDTIFPAMTAWTMESTIPLAVLAFVAVTLALAGIAQATSGPIYRLLTTPLFAWLGTISYSLYLWHPMILGVVKFAMYKLGIVALAQQAAPLVFFALAVPPALIVAHVSQRLLETRATNWLRARFGARRESRVSVAGSRSGL